jgi:hypothetical protein
MTNAAGRDHDDGLRDQVQRTQALVAALRLLLAQCLSERNEARAWAQAAAHRDWPGYLDVADPPQWLRHQPARNRLARSYVPASMLRAQAQVTHEIQEVVTDLAQMLHEFDSATPTERDLLFYVHGFNVLLIEVRALLTLLRTE